MTISDELYELIQKQAGNRCGYCLSSQQYVYGPLEIDHIFPQSLGGTDDEENLWLACRMCNSFKSSKTQAIDPLTRKSVHLYNPRQQTWEDHFRWSDDGTVIIGLTSCGRATIEALKLNNPLALVVRQAWVTAGWHPPDIQA